MERPSARYTEWLAPQRRWRSALIQHNRLKTQTRPAPLWQAKPNLLMRRVARGPVDSVRSNQIYWRRRQIRAAHPVMRCEYQEATLSPYVVTPWVMDRVRWLPRWRLEQLLCLLVARGNLTCHITAICFGMR